MTHGSSSIPGSSASLGRSRSATVANPPKSAPPGGTPPEKEKRKRSRVTPEQLTHLERIFALDRSPTAAKRKEISEMLGMQERQTQIWFQNRRAKAKTLEGKGKLGFRGSPTSGGDSPPDTPPDFGASLDVDLQTLIHEDEPVTFIPCSDLSIGSWRRISASLGQHDLVAYISNSKRCLT
ncbi:Homeodomain-like protein, partial [Gautieria morchelliformis]